MTKLAIIFALAAVTSLSAAPAFAHGDAECVAHDTVPGVGRGVPEEQPGVSHDAPGVVTQEEPTEPEEPGEPGVRDVADNVCRRGRCRKNGGG